VTDLDNDPLAAAFTEFRAEVSPLVRPAGATRTRETVRSRKRNHTIALGALATLVVAIPVAIQATTGDRHGPPPATGRHPVVDASSAPFFEPPRQTGPATTVPPGGISRAQLYGARLDLPSWGSDPRAKNCPAGPTQVVQGVINAGRFTLWVDEVVYADINHDGAYETIARIVCGQSFGDPTSQVVAFRRDAGGGIRTIAQVTRPAGTVIAICGLRADSAGAIEVQVADFPIPFGCSDAGRTGDRFITTQWRTFSWNGSTFVASGPTEFPPNPYASDIALSSSDLILLRQANGHYRGTMTLTVRNLGSATMSYRTDTSITTGWHVVETSNCILSTREAGGGIDDAYCAGTGLRGGSKRTITLTIDAPRRGSLDYTPSTELLYPENLGDPNGANNSAALHIRFQD
jgi:hypothetical protein